MNEEIQEAINNLNGVVKGIYRMDEAGLEIEDIEIILNYITNLQKRLDFMIDRNDEKEERIDKAIEYINSNECCEEWELDGNMVQDNILKILKGDE